jgi:hypothetical protein
MIGARFKAALLPLSNRFAPQLSTNKESTNSRLAAAFISVARISNTR